MRENHLRSIIKGASWRIIGTCDTIMLSLIFTGKLGKALRIGGIELFTKVALFWLHERIWMRLNFGKKIKIVNGLKIEEEQHYRSVIKGISWRIVGSLDTFWIALFVNRDSAHATQTAVYIVATEVVTKVSLFWLHERLWMKVKWGRKVAIA